MAGFGFAPGAAPPVADGATAQATQPSQATIGRGLAYGFAGLAQALSGRAVVGAVNQQLSQANQMAEAARARAEDYRRQLEIMERDQGFKDAQRAASDAAANDRQLASFAHERDIAKAKDQTLVDIEKMRQDGRISDNEYDKKIAEMNNASDERIQEMRGQQAEAARKARQAEVEIERANARLDRLMSAEGVIPEVADDLLNFNEAMAKRFAGIVTGELAYDPVIHMPGEDGVVERFDSPSQAFSEFINMLKGDGVDKTPDGKAVMRELKTLRRAWAQREEYLLRNKAGDFIAGEIASGQSGFNPAYTMEDYREGKLPPQLDYLFDEKSESITDKEFRESSPSAGRFGLPPIPGAVGNGLFLSSSPGTGCR